jgi:hypothetical protein
VMPGPAGGVPAAMAEAPSALPCHGASQDGAAAPSEGGSHICSLCDLCHNVVQVSQAALALATLPAAVPDGAAATAVEPSAPDGLFRPPRTLLA